MKGRFSTIDIIAIVCELQKYIGMRVNQVYDVDNKTYLFKLNRQEEKVTLLIESGIRIHTTEFQWPKNPAPSGFSMKLRKHLKNKRLEKLVQLGIDRVIDMQFGSNEAAYHVILELYDRGNIVLTDCTYTILNILRPRTIGSEDVKLVVRERYPTENARQANGVLNREDIYNALNAAKSGTNLKKILMPCLPFGPAVLEHVLLQSKFPKNCSVGKNFNISSDINHLFLCLEEAEKFIVDASSAPCKGYIIQKSEKNPDPMGNDITANVEFHPFLFAQHKSSLYTEYPSFDKTVDNFFSSVEGQKIDMKALQKEREAMKKLENFKKDHEKRLQQLQVDQETDVRKAQLIEMNLQLVDRAILAVQSTIASQISWSDIRELLKEAQQSEDPTACSIHQLKLEINHITLILSDPYSEDDSSSLDDSRDTKPSVLVDIDLDLSAYANARKYYDMKRYLANKERKTLESSVKAYKSAERKTKQALKEVAVTTSITKARKTFWFEKFLWFISSQNYLVIAGRDIQQNELIVKRYMKPGDVYVHADIHGASTVIIKNFQGGEIPPKTLTEAGVMAVCYSSAWDAKIVTSAWWVYHHQVSKTAPTGEYLTPGSFMIRGKKNYLPPCHLVLGFGFLFKLDEDSMESHIDERNSKSDENQGDEDKMADDDNQDEGSNLMSGDGSSSENEDQQAEEIRENASDDEDLDACNERKVSCSSSVEFPDTEVKFDLLKIESSPKSAAEVVDTTMIVQVPRRVRKERKGGKDAPVKEAKDELESSKKETKQGVSKRGHRGKLKKMKEKYKDQDEEERELRMKILASAGEPKEDKKKKKNKDAKAGRKANNKQKLVHFSMPAVLEVSKPTIQGAIIVEHCNEAKVETEGKSDVLAVDVGDMSTVVQEHLASDDEAEDLESEVQTSDEIKILCSLTGSPIAEDTLLFAVPVCAPYMVMQNYKYKVKVMPGTGKRGKASKTALHMFLNDKLGTPREKDLLRSLKDQDISRNFPGKVKLSAPNLRKIK